jgi:phosphate:Na+ symporter
LSLNTCGTVLILPFLEPYCRFIALTSDDLMRQVANAHSIFNILIVCVFLPLTDQLKKLILFIIPVAENEEIQLTNLDKRFLQTPPIALNQAESHLKMVAVTVKNKINIILTVLRQKPGNNDEIIEKFAKFEEYSKQRKQIGRDLNQFLVYLAQKELSDEMSREVTRLIYLNKDLEIIATQLGKFMGVLFEQAEKNITISESGKDELNICLTRLNEIFADLTRFENLTDEQSANISILINTQNMLIAEARNLLISRIRSSEHSPYESIVLLDSLRSMDSLLSSMRYTFEHLFYKF